MEAGFKYETSFFILGSRQKKTYFFCRRRSGRPKIVKINKGIRIIRKKLFEGICHIV